MKNKIIVSLLLVLLVAISLSAVSAEDNAIDDAISDSTDAISIDDSATDSITDEISKNSDGKALSDIGGNNIVPAHPQNITNDTEIKKSMNQYVSNNTIELEGNVNLSKTNYTVEMYNPIVLNASYRIHGGIFHNMNNLDYFFEVTPKSQNGPIEVELDSCTFVVNGNENIMIATGENITSRNYINLAAITIKNCKIIAANNETDISNVILLNINTDRPTAGSSGRIYLSANTLNGAIGLEIGDKIYNLSESDTLIIPNVTIKYDTHIEMANITTLAYDPNVDNISYYPIKLIDEEGNPVVGPLVTIYGDRIEGMLMISTDENGTAKLPLKFNETGSVYAVFAGNDNYNAASMEVGTITVNKKASYLTVKNYSFKTTATKTLTATFKDKNGNLVKGRKVTFTVYGKTYTATTNAKGVASVKISLVRGGTYTYTAKFAGDAVYKAVTAKGTLKLTKVASALTVKKYTFKKAAKKTIKVTLKSGSTLLKSKKISIKVNGKTFSAKTNSKGVASIVIKLTKKGTFSYTAKFAGDVTYKASSKAQKIVIK